MKNLLILLAIFPCMISCNGQSKPIGEEPLDLEKLNFSTKIIDLFPEKYKSKTYPNAYELPEDEIGLSTMFKKDSTFVNRSKENQSVIGFEYKQVNWGMEDSLAVFKNQYFQKINIATTLDGRIKVINGVADELTKIESQNLFKNLKNKYGNYKKLKNTWGENLTTYEWVQKDKIIRFVTAYDDESTTMKIIINQEKGSISNGEKEPHFVSYLFIINPALKDEVFGKLKTGDLSYISTSTE